MQEDKLFLFPPRLGAHKIDPPQLRRANQFDANSGCATVVRKSPAKCPAQAALADLGICLMMAQSTGCQDVDGVGDSLLNVDRF